MAVSKRQLIEALFTPSEASAGVKWLLDHGFVPMGMYGIWVECEFDTGIWAYKVRRKGKSDVHVLVGHCDGYWVACVRDEPGVCGEWRHGGTPAQALSALDKEQPLAKLFGWTP